ncbi:MAG: hypothetical protein IIW14_08345 [Kiritimatiellae bacterium]|nr:hypothetical protein [Kiritimatiellia bacterium]
MRIGIYKDTLANKRGADVAVTLLADGLKERGHDAVLFEKNELDGRLGETWDAIISAGTNELLDLPAAPRRRSYSSSTPTPKASSNGNVFCATAASAGHCVLWRPFRFCARNMPPRCSGMG